MGASRREAKEKNRESWYMAYIMDTNDEERAKGKTVEVGQASLVSCRLLVRRFRTQSVSAALETLLASAARSLTKVIWAFATG